MESKGWERRNNANALRIPHLVEGPHLLCVVCLRFRNTQVTLTGTKCKKCQRMCTATLEKCPAALKRMLMATECEDTVYGGKRKRQWRLGRVIIP